MNQTQNPSLRLTGTTEEIREKYALQMEDNLIKTISRTSADILVVVDIESKEILFQSRTVGEELGYEVNHSHDLFYLMHPDDIPAMKEHIDRMKTANEGEVREIEYRMRAPDNSYHIFRDRNTVFKWDENGVPAEKLGIVQDVTKARNADQEIKNLNRMLILKNRELAAANTELATFNDAAAQDYAQTLKTLYTNLEFVANNDGNRLPDKIRANIRNAQSSIQKLKLLTDDLIAFSRIMPAESRTAGISLDTLVQEVISELDQSFPDVRAIVSLSPLPAISGYPDLLSLLFFQLLSNILKFAQGKSAVRFTCKKVDGDPLLFTEMLDVDYYQIMVSASHFTLDNEDSEKIFSLFHMLKDRKYKGAGASLAVCRKIMELHQGFINVLPTSRGAVFSCYFPVNTFNHML